MKPLKLRENIEALECVRTLFVRKHPEQERYEVLITERSDNDSRSSGYELPGKKVFSSVSELKKFVNGSTKKRNKARRDQINQVLQGKLGLNQDLDFEAQYLGAVNDYFGNGNYKLKDKRGQAIDKSPEFTGRKTTFYTIFVDDSFDQTISTKHDWIPLEDISDESLVQATSMEEGSVLDTNSSVMLMPNFAERIASLIRQKERANLDPELSKAIELLIKAELAKSDPEKRARPVRSPINGREITTKDIARPDLWLTKAERLSIFEHQCGSLEEPQTIRHFVWAIPEAIKYCENHCQVTLSKEIKAKLYKHNADADFVKQFLEGFGDPKLAKECRYLYQAISAFVHLKNEAPWIFDASEMTAMHDAFTQKFNNTFDQGKMAGKVRLKQAKIKPTKDIYRIIDKLITNAEADFSGVKDIFGFRLVAQDPADIRQIKNYAQKNYPGLKKKRSTNPNRSSAFSGSVYLESTFQGIPFEAQIIDETTNIKISTEDKHHYFYVMIKNHGVRDTRELMPRTESEVEAIIEELSKNPKIQSQLNVTMSPQKMGKKFARGDYAKPVLCQLAAEKLWAKWRRNCFLFDNPRSGEKEWIAYQEVLRIWKSPVSEDNDAHRERMFAVLNQRVGAKVDWEALLETPDDYLVDLEDDAVVLERVLRVADSIPSFSLPDHYQRKLRKIKQKKK